MSVRSAIMESPCVPSPIDWSSAGRLVSSSVRTSQFNILNCPRVPQFDSAGLCLRGGRIVPPDIARLIDIAEVHLVQGEAPECR